MTAVRNLDEVVGSRRVIVVDDQAVVLEEIVARLGGSFDDLVVLDDPSEVVRRLKGGEEYGVLVVDVEMQPFNGLQLLKLARDLDADAQVLVMTANSTADVAIGALKAGAVDFVIKPIADWDALARSISRALDARATMRHNASLVAELNRSKAELDQAVDLLRRLNVTTQKMHQSRNGSEIINLLLTTITECLHAKRVSIMIRDPKTDEMVVQAATGVDKEKVRGLRVKPWEGIAGTVLAQRAPIVVSPETGPAQVPADAEREQRYGSKAFMCIPITLAGADRNADRVMGVVNMTDREEDRPFSPMEIEFASHLGRQAAFALTSAALWAQRGK